MVVRVQRDRKEYADRGITICERWRKFPNFLADMGQPAAGATLDRRDNDGNYEPGNCRWATRKEQARNTRRNVRISYNGREQTIAEWAEECGVDYFLLYSRYKKYGWTPAEMLGEFLPAMRGA